MSIVVRQPLTRAQKALWALQQSMPLCPVNIAEYVELTGVVDVDLLRTVTQEVGRHTGVAFTRFEQTSSAVEQVIDRDLSDEITVKDLRGEPDPRDTARQWMHADYTRPVDLFTDRLMASAILQVADDTWLFYQRGHHLIMDGSGAFAMLKMVADVYDQRISTGVVATPPASDLAGLAQADADYATSSRLEKDREYWREQVAGLAAPVTLSHRLGPAEAEPVRASGILPSDTFELLKRAEIDLRTTLPVVVAAAIAGYLARVAGRDDVALSLPVAARTTAVLRRTFSTVSNVVPLPTGVGSGTSVASAVASVQGSMMGALRHQRFRFEDMRELMPAGNQPPSSREFAGPLLNLMLTVSELRFGDALGSLHLLSTSAVDDLAINLYRTGNPLQPDELRFDLEANPNRYSADELRGHHSRLLQFIESVAKAAVTEPSQTFDDIVLMSGDEGKRLPLGARIAPQPQTLRQLLDDSAARHAHRTALDAGTEQWTYAVLSARSRQLANMLKARGAAPGTTVAIATGRGPKQVLAFWAVAHTGATMLQIDPAHPIERIKAQLVQADPILVLTAAGGVEPLGDEGWCDLTDLCLSGIPDTPIELPRELSVNDLAYLVYTSGSTGTPKGVQVTHRGLAALTEQQRLLGVSETSRVSGLASPAFDASIFEILLAASGGATLCPAPSNVAVGQELSDFLTSNSVSHTVITPSVLGTLDPAILPAGVCTTLMLAGEACPPDVARRWGSGREVFNLYGPAESTIMATGTGALAGIDEQRPAIGTPIAAMVCLVLDHRMRPVPPGVVGDLYLAGPALAQGYSHQPALTAGSFVANPWSSAGERMYRTGDRGRWDETFSQLHYVGRSDDQVQIRGVRVEPGEISMAALTHPDVQQAAAIVVDTGHGTQLALYVVGISGGRGLSKRVRSHIASRLPTSMWPAHIVVLDDALPVTTTGKLDRAALPHPDTVRVDEHRPARTVTEKALAQAISDVLNIPSPSMYGDILALGGSSLDATRIGARVTELTGRPVGVRDVLEAADLAELAELIDRKAGGPEPIRSLTARPARPPATPAQVSLVLADRLQPGSTANHLGADIDLVGPLNRQSLTEAIADVVDRHEALRTIIRLEADGTAWQDVIALRDVLQSNLFESHGGAEDFDHLPIDPTVRPPLTVTLASIGPEVHRLTVRTHHAVVDGWSLGVLTADLTTAYTARLHGHAPAWAPTTQYIDANPGNRVDPETYAAQLESWKHYLAGLAPRPELPADLAAPATISDVAPAAVVRRTLGPSVSSQLSEAAAERGVSTFAWLHAGLAATVSRYTGADDFVIVVPQAGRIGSHLDNAVGMYVNPVAVRSRIAATDAFDDVLAQSADGLAFALGSADVPLGTVAGAVDPRRDITASPLSDILLTYQNHPAGQWDIDGLQIAVRRHAPAHARVMLQWIVEETAEGLEVELTYRSDQFSAPMAAALCQAYVTALAQSVARPKAATAQLVPGFQTPQPARMPDRGTLVRRILDVAAASPDSPALVVGEETYTYRRLVDEAGVLAAELTHAGIGRGARVAVALPRDAGVLVAQLAVMWSGAAYVPFDPEYPEQRIRAILEDAQPSVVVVNTATRHRIPGEFELFDVDVRGRPVGELPDINGLGAADGAYVIFTSGSTGRPKGVAVTHGNVMALLQACEQSYGFTAADVFTCTHSTGFDVSVFEIFAAWTSGAQVVLVDRQTVQDPQALWPLLHRRGATILSQTPSSFYPLAAVAARDGDLGRLRAVVFAGEALRPARLIDWYNAFGDRVLLSNMYGITETTVHNTVGEVTPKDPRSLLGAPLAGMSLLILDRGLQPVPVGAWGELYVRGPQVTRGYIGRPGLTAQRFVACPTALGGGRMYRSGDVVRRTIGGDLEYRGRSDRQVQVRGYRVEPGDIAGALQTISGVAEAEVVIRNTESVGGGDITGYVRLHHDRSAGHVDEDHLRTAAQQLLPGYLVPARIVVVPQWPLNASGKRDLSALPEPAVGAADTIDGPGETDSPVYGVVAEVLAVDVGSINPALGLFDLGANSLSAMHIAFLLSERTGRDISVRMVAGASTVADLESAVRTAPLQINDSSPARNTSPPPTPQQRALWALSRIDSSNAVYHLPAVITLPAEATPRSVVDALMDVVARHEVLRTVLSDNGGLPQPQLVPLDQIRNRLAGMLTPRPLPGAHAAANLQAEARAPFDLTTDLPWRAELFEPAGHDTGLRLLLVAHHVAVDGWSMTVLAQDFGMAFESRRNGTAPLWPAPAAQYRDHAWRTLQSMSTDGRSSAHRDRVLAHWSSVLDGAPIHLPLPYQAFQGQVPIGPEPAEYIDITISKGTRSTLQRLAVGQGASVFHVLHAALSATIGQFTGTEDVVMGTPTAGRTTEMLSAVGMFVQTVLLRTDARPAVTLRAAIDQSHQVVADAVAHADVSFDEVKERLAPPQALGSDAFLDVLVAYQLAPEGLTGQGVSVTPIRVGQARVPLEFTITDRGDGADIDVTVTFGLWHLHPDMAERLAGAFIRTVDAMAGDVDPAAVTMHQLTTPGELELPCVAPSEIRVDDDFVDVAESIVLQAHKSPDAAAIVDEQGATTYAELVEQAGAVAGVLVGRGVGGGDLVAVMADRTRDTVVAMVGVLLAGAGYVPVEPTYPAERISTILRDADPVVVIGHSRYRSITPELADIVDIGVTTPTSEAMRELQQRDAAPRPQDPAYVIYTSGSTGNPKGVTVTRSNMTTLLKAALSAIDAVPGDVWTWFHSAAFDFSVWEIFGPLTSGGQVVVVDHDIAREPAGLIELLNRHGVTVLNQTPTAFSRLLQLPDAPLPGTLRLVLFGGEALDPKALADWSSGHPEVRLVNMYGITETTVHASVIDVDVTDARSLIGSALPGLGLMVLDRRLRPQPVGATGELYITGPQVSAGYANMPALSALRFVAAPWGSAGTRMYRTGDLARWIDDTNLEYLGRGDQQLKIRGHRFEPGEITAVLRAQPGVSDAKVVLHNRDRAGDEVLIGYVLVDSDDVSRTQLRTACAAVLPTHLVPAQVQIVDDWPTTSSGKLDVGRLPALTMPEVDRPLRGAEVSVATAVAQVLDIPVSDIGPESNFFELGGNSLSAARLSAAIGAITGCDLPVRSIFEHPTIALLSTAVEDSGVHGSGLPTVRPSARPRPARLPLTPQQQALWLHWQVAPDLTDYNLSGLIPVPHPSADGAEALVRAMIVRHEGLRTSFPADQDGPWQQLWNADTIELDLTTQLVADPVAALAELDRPFDLVRELPWRVAVFESPMHGKQLAVVVHHIAVDGESIRVLQQEVSSLIAGTSLPPTDLGYGDYTLWSGDVLSHHGEILRRYWEGVFAEPVALPQLPGLRPAVADPGLSATVEITLDQARFGQLQQQAQAYNSSPFMVVHSALAVLLSRLADEPDVVIGTVAAGRDVAEFAQTVGMFARTVLLRTVIDLEQPFSAILRQVTRTDLDSFAHSSYPADAVAALADPDHLRGTRPVVDVFLADVGVGVPVDKDLYTGVEAPHARFGLDLTIAEVEGTLQIRLIYSTARTDAADAELFVGRLANLLCAVLDDPDVAPSHHLVGTVDEFETTAPVGGAATLPELLQRNVFIDPMAVACEDGEWSLTYRDLDSASTAAARALIERGMGPGDVVAICVERSLWSVIATWAIAKTGAAFVTLGVGDPDSRQRAMIAATGATVGVHGPESRPATDIDWLDLAEVSAPSPGTYAPVFNAGERLRPIIAHDVAYVIFTSGSTGEPKGVSVTHAGLPALVDAVIERTDLTPASRVLHNYSTGFDAHLIELIPAFAAGATVVVCPPAIIGGRELGDFLQRKSISTFFSTPAVMATMEPEAITTVRIVATGGESLSAAVAHRWSPGRRIVNFYGPTEATIAVTANPSVVPGSVIPIGRSMAAATAYILDHRLRPVPHGVVGELYLAGAALARGYVGAGALTAGRFLANPFGSSGSRMYRTGDLVHRTTSGDLVVHGRSDEQVKVRGIRLEPAEIDAALMSLPGVERATTGISAAGPAPVLVSWLIADPDHPCEVGEVRDRLRHILPASHIPTHIMVVDHFPMTPSGKLDRRSLPAPSVTVHDVTPPNTPTEFIVADIWAEVLECPVQTIGRESEFFAGGGTSLSASRVAGRLRQQTRRDVTVRQVLDARTLADLAAAVDLLPSVLSDDAPRHLPVPAELGLAYPQRRLWVLNRIDPSSTAYLIPLVLKLDGDVDPTRLADAVAHVQRKHGSLRTTYPQTVSGPRQLVGDPAQVTEPAVTEIPRGDVAARVAEFVTAPFDLTIEPGFRGEVLTTGDGETWLVLVLHHVAADGWSMPLLVSDLVDSYAGKTGTPAELTYADFTQWQTARLGDPSDPSSRYAAQLAFWQRELQGVTGPVRLPGRTAATAVDGTPGVVRASIDAAMLADLTRVGQAESATLFHVAHTALAALYAQRTGHADLVVGAPVLGRDDPAWESVVGMFVNTLPLRTRIVAGQSAREVLRGVRDTDLTAHAHADVPYDAVARAVTAAVDVAGSDPLTSVLLVHQEALGGMSSGGLSLPGVNVDIVSDTAGLVAPKYDVEVVLASGSGGGLDITLVHGPAIPEDLAAGLLIDFQELLRAIAIAPDQPFPVRGTADLGDDHVLTGEVLPAAPVVAIPIEVNPELERIVTSAMATVLDVPVESVGRADNFFDLGGSSLSATQVVAIIGEATARSVPVRHVFAAPSPAALAYVLDNAEGDDAEELPPLTGRGAPPNIGAIPLSPAQNRLWLVQQILPERPLYSVPVVVGVPPGADPHGGWRAVAARHAPLRTRYPEVDGVPVQVTIDEAPEVVELGDREVIDVVSTLLATRFELTASVPVRAALVDQSGHRFLVIVAHHIAMDGQSAELLRRDLDAVMAGEVLSPLPVGYGQVARWLHVVNGRRREEMLEFWQQSLTGYPGVLELPDSAPREPQRSLATATVSVPVESDIAADVERAARRLGVSEFHVYHAALALTLSIACGTDDVAVGTPVSLRRHPDTADMIGMFVSTVALRTTLRTGMTTADLIAEVRDTDLAALDHALLPFDELVAQLDPIREMGRHPIVQVTLSVNDEAGGPVPDGLSPSSEFDLQVTVGRGATMFTYATALYDKRAIETLALRWKLGLRLLVSEEDVSLESADLRTEEERAHRLHRVPSGQERTLGAMLMASVRNHPHTVAVDDGVRTRTYAELDRWASVVAADLLAAGVAVGDPVAMMLPRSLESVVAFWAIARIGAVYVPIDPRYPAERIERMVTVSGARVAVADRSTPRYCRVHIQVAVAAPQGTADPTVDWVPLTPDNTAYLLFTSGTTGQPNGVTVAHRGLRNLLEPVVFTASAGDRVSHLATPSFDASILEMVWAFGSGATLAVVRADDTSGRTLTEQLQVLGVTQVFATPSVLATLDESVLTGVHSVYVGGESCPPELVRRWSPGRSMSNLYGPTETTVLGTSNGSLQPDNAAIIGRGVPGLRSHVLDSHLRPTPDGAVGELYFTGGALADGYHGDASLTASRFVAGPAGERMYRTGDLVRRLQSGELEYRGRADRQVKIRGQRVEPAEIDAALISAGARSALTVLRTGPTGPVLVSYVTTAGPGQPTPEHFLDSLVATVPHHLIPAAIVPVPELPRTQVGKLDVAALPEPSWSVTGGAPRTETESVVVEVFREILGIPEMGIYDDFFAIGGNSLLLASASAALTNRFGRPVPAAVLFAQSTPAGLAAALDRYADLNSGLGAVVELSTGARTGTPLWCIHPISGLVLDYRPLGEVLPTPVLGLQMPGLDDPAAPHLVSIEQMAAHHVATIRQHQAVGPYRLLGWSLGAVLAHEVTRQLTATGATVELLVIIDPRLDPDTEGGAAIDESVEHTLRAIDPERYEQYRIRCAEAVTAAVNYVPEPATAESTVFVSALDNPNPEQWRALSAGPLAIEESSVVHHAMGAAEAMTAIAETVVRHLPPADQNRQPGQTPGPTK